MWNKMGTVAPLDDQTRGGLIRIAAPDRGMGRRRKPMSAMLKVVEKEGMESKNKALDAALKI